MSATKRMLDEQGGFAPEDYESAERLRLRQAKDRAGCALLTYALEAFDHCATDEAFQSFTARLGVLAGAYTAAHREIKAHNMTPPMKPEENPNG